MNKLIVSSHRNFGFDNNFAIPPRGLFLSKGIGEAGGSGGSNTSFSSRLEKIYMQQKLDYIYSVFYKVYEYVAKDFKPGRGIILKPKGLPYKLYSVAYTKYKHWLGKEHMMRFHDCFNPQDLLGLNNAMDLLEEKAPNLIKSNGELWRLYRMLGVPDEAYLERIRTNGLDWYIDQVNEKINDWVKNKDHGYVGKYKYKTWDCYDFVTALLYAVENGITNAMTVKDNSGWKTTDSIYNYGYDWIHASHGPKAWAGLKKGMIVFAQQCSPNNGRFDHWGIVGEINGELKVIHRSSAQYPLVNDLDWFYRYSNKENGKSVHVYYPKV